MKLSRLLNALGEVQFSGDEEMDISSIEIHSKKTGPNSLFIAIPGLKSDGHDFLEKAYNAGVRAFVTQKPFKRPGAATIIVPDSRTAVSELAAEFYCHPTKTMTLIGITGTNGKTTTAFLLESILNEAGHSPGILSTIEYRYKSHKQKAENTTPDPVTLQKIFREMADADTKYAVMEVSSHGLNQHRVENCHFNTAIFTNLTPEHLDYHGTMDEYYLSKERFFTEILRKSSKKNRAAVINLDDPMGRLLLERIPCKTISYGLKNGDVHAENTLFSASGIQADIVTKDQTFSIKSLLTGTFNLYNILAAIAASMHLNISTKKIIQGIEKTTGIPGRMERIENNKEIFIFVDYAHTGDALENVLKTLKKVSARKILTVFGCGGDRDQGKRPVMGRVAADYSSVVILTSDNPRSEDPGKIIREIEKGVVERGFTKAENNSDTHNTGQRYFVIKDRRTAIQKAISLAQPGDVVLIAGKGHETYQQTGDGIIHFDDREEVRRALNSMQEHIQAQLYRG